MNGLIKCLCISMIACGMTISFQALGSSDEDRGDPEAALEAKEAALIQRGFFTNGIDAGRILLNNYKREVLDPGRSEIEELIRLGCDVNSFYDPNIVGTWGSFRFEFMEMETLPKKLLEFLKPLILTRYQYRKN